MMKSKHLIDDTLFAFLDEELNPQEAADVAAHLAVCSDCAQMHSEYVHLFKVIDTAPERGLKKDLTGVVMARLQPFTTPRFLPLASALQLLTAIVILAVTIPILFGQPVFMELLPQIQAALDEIPTINEWLTALVQPASAAVEQFFVQGAERLRYPEQILSALLSIIPLLITSSVMWVIGNSILIRKTLNRSS